MEKMNDCQMMTRFIEENTDIALKYLIWQENFLAPQVFDNSVQVEADDVECETITINLDKDGNIT